MFGPAAYLTTLTAIPTPADWDSLAQTVYEQAFRTTLDRPGFALLRFQKPIASEVLRRGMISLKQALGKVCQLRRGTHLVYQSMARFDQQVTTKFHLDGGAAESFLLLGYEASDVASQLALADFSRAAHDLGLPPARFLDDYNPMFAVGECRLHGTITPLEAFQPGRDQLLVINNSLAASTLTGDAFLGVLHQATIPHPDLSRRRIINSTMLFTADTPQAEVVTPEQQAEYVIASAISGSAKY